MTACPRCGHHASKCQGCGRVDEPTMPAPTGAAVARWNHARGLFLRIQCHGDTGQLSLLQDHPGEARSHLRFIQDAARELEGILRADQTQPVVTPTVEPQRRIDA